MTLHKRFQPRALLRLTVAGLIAFFTVPYVVSRYWTGFSADAIDGIRGVLLGIVLGLLFLSKVSQRRQSLSGPRR